MISRLLKKVFRVHLPWLVCVVCLSALALPRTGASASTHHSTTEQQEYSLSVGRISSTAFVSEGIGGGVFSPVTKIRDHMPFGWWACPETIEQSLSAGSVRYLDVRIAFYRFRSTDMIYPFHTFL